MTNSNNQDGNQDGFDHFEEQPLDELPVDGQTEFSAEQPLDDWQDGAPVDDYIDAEITENEQPPAADKKANKKTANASSFDIGEFFRKNWYYGLGVVMAAFIGFMAIGQFSDGSAPAPQGQPALGQLVDTAILEAPSAPVPVGGNTAPAAPTLLPGEAAQPTQELNNLYYATVQNNNVEQQTAAPQPATDTATTGSVTGSLMPTETTATPGFVPTNLPDTIPGLTAPVAEQSIPLAPAIANTTLTPSAVPTDTPAIVASSDTDARVVALTSRVDELKNNLDQVTAQLNAMSGMMAVNTGTTSTAALEEKIVRLEERLAAKTSSSKTDVKMDAQSGFEMVPVVKGDTVRKSTTTKPSKPKITKPKVAPAPKWVVRAASPGMAWVAKNETTRELVRVEIGDEVSGIGQVQSIRQIGDNWVIQGTNGSIR
jgi:hypothetical protein